MLNHTNTHTHTRETPGDPSRRAQAHLGVAIQGHGAHARLKGSRTRGLKISATQLGRR